MCKNLIEMSVTYIIIACYPDKGMKSYGSKSLISFGKKRLIEYQLDIISKNKIDNYETIIISNFDTYKIQKMFSGTSIRVISLEEKDNPINIACKQAKYNNIVFIDYGCLINHRILKKMIGNSAIVCSNNDSTLDTGCVINDNKLEHIFFDLPDNKFCKIFSLSENDKKKILKNQYSFNLLPFEIINELILDGSNFSINDTKNGDFLYFTHIKQKNDVNKFIKKTFN